MQKKNLSLATLHLYLSISKEQKLNEINEQDLKKINLTLSYNIQKKQQ